jgi:perosamine synthetase
MKRITTLSEMVVASSENLRKALQVIDNNSQGICFVVDDGKLLGVLTDGDIRRLLLNSVTLECSVIDHMRIDFVTLDADADNEAIQEALTDKIRHIPMIDKNGKLVDYASYHRYHHIPLAEPRLDGNELAYVTDCISTNWISSQGKYVNRFESMFSEYTHGNEAIAVSNGTVALHLALAALGIGQGDEVIAPDFTFAASINAILHAGATPVLVDVDIETWTIEVGEIEKALTNRTKAIMPVHLYGHPCDMDPIMKVARDYNLFVIEDCAEAVGSHYRDNHVGTFGDAATFSFYGNKTITTGEGGMVLFRDKSVAKTARKLRDHGMRLDKRYWHDVVGYNYRLTNVQAAIGVAQMERVEHFVQHKRNLAKTYHRALQNMDEIRLPLEAEWATSSYWLYTILLKDDSGIHRDDLIQRLLMNGIEARPVFYPMHLMPPYSLFNGERSLKNTKNISRRGISLPSASTLTESQVQEIASVIKNNFETKKMCES